jgi:hypothetical protein
MRTKAPRALPSRSRQGRAGPGPGIRKAPFPTPGTGLGLYTADGARKYVTASEREAGKPSVPTAWCAPSA